MINSIQSVKDNLKNVSKEKNIDFNSAMRFYMYDRFIERLSVSKYKDNFILKGGFYLSMLFGIDNRNTMDIDTSIRNTSFTDENIIKMIEEIISIDIDDNVMFWVERNKQIRNEDEYGGLRVTLGFSLEGFKDSFHIDVATGDPIHPGPNDYGYKSLMGNKKYNVWAYSIETVLAEKIETILHKLDTSSRMKDYYDIYLIFNKEFEKININNFRMAAEKTFKKRQFNEDLFKCLNIVKYSNKLKTYWVAYTRKNSYAKNISYEDTIECLEKFVELLVPIVV